jgi:hypothetical protein
VKKRLLASSLAIFVLGIGRSLAADSSATVTEAFEQVEHGSSQTANAEPAKQGTRIADGEYLKTGVKSRAELQLPDLTITRMGANTIFNYTVANNEVDLQAGTILFSKPKDGKQMNIKTAAVTAAIVGTTGFIHVHGHDFLFGLIEGKAYLTIGGAKFPVGPGQIFQYATGGTPRTYSYNVPLMLETSTMITGFTHPLPNQAFIDKEVAEYDDLVARGFIQKPKAPYFVDSENGVNPNLPIVAYDSAKQALGQFLTPPPPPPPPPTGG